MSNLPEPARVVQLPDGTYVYADHLPAIHQPTAAPQMVHQHIRQAAPDRTVQRLALGSGIDAGAVAAGVYFGPLLVGALTAIAANLAILAFLAVHRPEGEPGHLPELRHEVVAGAGVGAVQPDRD
ncbi:DUF6251 family protein [Streptomyces lateritius]|uniref:DUF6251 family protein n=1 Tax=Streptomyces lateritius TaxID=67313 RepID=UPI001E2DC4E8|nr:DUF6251 family protein [Streptomyces lateritius]